MKQIDVAIGVIQQGGLVLICQRRKDDSAGNLWEFPGGKIEPGESPEQCVVREIVEELGIQVRPTESFPVIEHTYEMVAVRIYPYLCTLLNGIPLPLASQRIQWVPPDRLFEYPFPAANARLIGQIVKRVAATYIPKIAPA